jgi:V8-like Glu-specific endopeptidase
MNSKRTQKARPPAVEAADDFKQIDGIGAGIERRLRQADILTYEQLADLSPEEIAAHVADMTGLSAERIASMDWTGQARRLAAVAEQEKADEWPGDDLGAAERPMPKGVRDTKDARAAAVEDTRQPTGNRYDDKAPGEDRQPYATFTTQLWINETNQIQRTKTVHIQTGREASWPGWAGARVPEWMLLQTPHMTPTASKTHHEEVDMSATTMPTASTRVEAAGALGDDTPVVNAGAESSAGGSNGSESAEMVYALETGEVKDAWEAVREGVQEAGRRAGGLELAEIIQDRDDRVRVDDTTLFPWRLVCSLNITAADGTRWIGTGWIAGPNTVVTAGHCVYIHSHGGWVRQVEVIPGRDGASRPFSPAVSTSFRSVTGWTQGRQMTHDYGAILLRPIDSLASLGNFGVAALDAQTLSGEVVNLSGYPGDKPVGTQWFHSREIETVEARRLTYKIDTIGGQSGAPIWRKQGENRHVVGIHTNGDRTRNSGTRITLPVFNNIQTWINGG